MLAGKGKAKFFDIKDEYWIDVDDEKTFKKAENTLLDTLKKSLRWAYIKILKPTHINRDYKVSFKN